MELGTIDISGGSSVTISQLLSVARPFGIDLLESNTIKEGSSGIPWRAFLKVSGSPVQLDNASVLCIIQNRTSGATRTLSMVADTAFEGGVVRYPEPSDLVAGDYSVEIQTTFEDGTIVTLPQAGVARLTILPTLS